MKTTSRTAFIKAKLDGRVRPDHETGFTAYYADVLEKFSTVRTLLNTSDKISVADLYVNLDFTSGNEKFTGDQILELISKANGGLKVCIIGLGGCGKSMFFRNTVTSLIMDEANTLPVPFELKSLNDMEDIPLIEAIHQTISLHDGNYSLADLEDDFRNERVVLLLDGFDEVDHDKRRRRHREITDLSSKFTNLTVVMTSRPDESGAGFHIFTQMHVDPLKLSQCKELVSKINFDNNIKDQFKQRLEEDLYEKHQTYLSNPLLLTMMLLTFSQSGDVPNELTEFYNQTFEALYYKHDRLKGGMYKRTFKTKLQTLEFKKLFSHFCAATYSENKLDFSDTDACDFLNQGVSYYSYRENAEDILFDLIESTCLLKRDGINATFVHRSFQEYFTAVFIVALDVQLAMKAMDAMLSRSNSDQVLSMIRQISPNLFDDWALPKCAKVLRAFEKDGIYLDPFRSMKFLYSRILSQYGMRWGFNYDSATANARFINFISQFYREATRPIWEKNRGAHASANSLSNLVKEKPELEGDVRAVIGDRAFSKVHDESFRIEFSVNRFSAETALRLGLDQFGHNHYLELRYIYEDMKARQSGRNDSFSKMFSRNA